MKYVRDSTFIAGSGRDSSFYHISVIDTSKPAYSLISTYDFAGNRTRVTSKYVKQSAVVLTLSDFDFGCIVVGSSKVDTATIATNSSQNSVTIDSVWVDDHIHFAFAGTPKLPVLLKSGLPQSFQFQYTAIGVEQDTTTIHFRSPEAGIRTAKLIGCGITPNSVRSYGYTSSLSRESPEYISLSSQLDRGNELALLPAIPNPATASGKSVRFVYGLRSDSPLDLSLFDILGNLIVTVVHVEHQSAGIYESDFPIGADMPAGSYIYRLAGTGKILSGKLVITR